MVPTLPATTCSPMRLAIAWCMLLFGCLDSPPASAPEVPAPKLFKAPLPPLEVEPPAPPETFDWKFTGELEVRDAVRDGRLALIPILSRDPAVLEHSYITLVEGMRQGDVVVRDSGEIKRVSITNRSRKPLIALGGELIVGGLQDRLLVRGSVIAPGRTHTVAAVCAESGRMAGGDRFYPSGAIAEPTLRHLARIQDQGAVWDRISSFGVIGSYRHVVARQWQGTNRARRDHLLKQLDAIDAREEGFRTIGFAVAIDDRVVAIEQFPTAPVYRTLRNMVIHSYVTATHGRVRRTERRPTAAEVRQFAETVGVAEPALLRSPPGAPSSGSRARP